MTAADWVWGGLLTAGAAFEVYALRNGRGGDTLSERTRAWFRVRTRAGAWTFAVAWIAFASWYLVHIIG
ncbi:hypothetical protein ACGFY0_45380 [Streptomyces chartreusis]|uniref:hypothetical protein n=1 Tax=Streptomyces chartreusis TaxID=1969 RepID=UPI00371E1770